MRPGVEKLSPREGGLEEREQRLPILRVWRLWRVERSGDKGGKGAVSGDECCDAARCMLIIYCRGSMTTLAAKPRVLA